MKAHSLNSPIVSSALPVPITALRLAEVLSFLTAKSSSDGETFYSIEKDKSLQTPLDDLPIAQAVAVPIHDSASTNSDNESESSDPTDHSQSDHPPQKKRNIFFRAVRKVGKFFSRHSAAIANTTLCVLSVASLTVLIIFTGPFGGILLVLGGLALGAAVGGVMEARAYHLRQTGGGGDDHEQPQRATSEEEPQQPTR